MKKVLLIIGIIIAVLVAVIAWNNYAANNYTKMAGNTMQPTFNEGDILKVDHSFTALNRGDIVVLKLPTHSGSLSVKRIVGLPGETVIISNGAVSINGSVLDEHSYFPNVPSTPNLGFSSLQLSNDQYFVLGDNRAQSFDSRSWGFLPRTDIVSKVTGKL